MNDISIDDEPTIFMKSLFEKMIGVKVPCDYGWDDKGIVRLRGDVAAYASGDFKGKCVIFLHGNGETAVSEKNLFDELNRKGVSVVSPDYRGYGLSGGEFSEDGCFEAAHAAYEWLKNEKHKSPTDIIPLGYSLGSGVAVELAATEPVAGLVLQAPYYSGRKLLPYWIKRFGCDRAGESRVNWVSLRLQMWNERSFATDKRLRRISCPALVFHGDCDTIIPIAHGKKVFNGLASDRKEFVRVAGGSHGDFQYAMGFENYIEKIVGFCSGAAAPGTSLSR